MTRARPPLLTAAALLAGLVAGAVLLLPADPVPDGAAVEVLRYFAPEQLAREEDFHRAVRPPTFAALGLGLAVALVLGLTPLGGRLVAAVARPLRGSWVAQVLLGTLALTTVGRLVALPLDVRREQVLRAYGLSTQTWGSWAVDAVKGLAVSSAIAGLALLVTVGLARRLPVTWWRWGAAGLAGLVLAGSFAYPLVVEPVFNTFRPLPAGALRTDLLALAERDGVPVRDVLVADASRRTTAVNAYVSGFGSTRRLVVYDTLVRSAPPAEVRLVVAHELGHAERSDVLVGTALGAVGAGAGVCLLAALLGWRPLLARAGAEGPGDPRVVALVLALVAVGTLVTAPAVNLASRRVEARADLHSLQLTGDPATFVAVQRRLAVTNLADLRPSPVLVALFATHPTVPERLALAEAYAEERR
ncbi:MAG: M48 family metallopeptidase [Actinomycetota bacterium]|nr:M48 family metallopeptidase [Actinomycetota bacterium]